MRLSVSGWWKAAVAAAVATVTIGVLPAGADAGDEARLLSLTNQLRSSQGLSPLTIDAQLTRVAQAWASTVSGRGVISHNSSLPSQLTGWKVLGENVGVGGTVDAIHQGFLASPTHHENLVDPAFTRVGFGIVRPDARIFVVEVFMRPSSAASTSPVATAPAQVAPPVPPVAAKPPVTVVASPKPVVPAKPAPAPTVVPVPPPSSAELLSPWMVHSLDRLRSMEPGKAA